MFFKWQQRWDIDKHNRRYGLIKPIIGNWYWTRHDNRFLDITMSRLRLERIGLNKYLYKIKFSLTNICSQCNSGAIESVEHFLMFCDKYLPQRYKLFTSLRKIGLKQMTIPSILGGADLNNDDKIKITLELCSFLFWLG